MIPWPQRGWMGLADLGLQGRRAEAAKANRGGNRPGKDRQEEDEEGLSSCRERETDRQTDREKWNLRVASSSDSASPKLLSQGLRSQGEVVPLTRMRSSWHTPWPVPQPCLDLGLEMSSALILNLAEVEELHRAEAQTENRRPRRMSNTLHKPPGTPKSTALRQKITVTNLGVQSPSLGFHRGAIEG